MQELLANPAVQAAAAPFLAALIVAAVLVRTRLAGLALCVALAVVAALTIGLSFEALTATRKLVLCGLASGAVVLLAGLAPATDRRASRIAVAAISGVAVAWVLLRILQQAEAPRAWLAGAAAVVFLAVLAYESVRGDADAVRAAAASLWLALGCGALALLGASAVLAEVGIALGAGAGAVLLVQMIAGRPMPGNWALGLPVAVGGGLAALIPAASGQLPWYSLLPLLAVPWAARAVPASGRGVRLDAFITAAAALVPALAAVGLAWYGAAPPA